MKNVYEIVKEYLVENGYDGLVTDGCGCSLDDLAPCMDDGCGDFLECRPGYKVDDMTGEEDWIMTTEKPR